MNCVWNMSSKCSDDVSEQLLFNGQIKVPICSTCLNKHKMVMTLTASGVDVEEIVELGDKLEEEYENLLLENPTAANNVKL